jgi:hypothetical protein
VEAEDGRAKPELDRRRRTQAGGGQNQTGGGRTRAAGTSRQWPKSDWRRPDLSGPAGNRSAVAGIRPTAAGARRSRRRPWLGSIDQGVRHRISLNQTSLHQHEQEKDLKEQDQQPASTTTASDGRSMALSCSSGEDRAARDEDGRRRGRPDEIEAKKKVGSKHELRRAVDALDLVSDTPG